MDNFIDAPTKGMHELTLLSTEERLKGRPKICSDCGLCDTSDHIAPQLEQQPLIDEGARQQGVEGYMRRSVGEQKMPTALMRKFIAFMQHHVYQALKRYGESYQATYGREL